MKTNEKKETKKGFEVIEGIFVELVDGNQYVFTENSTVIGNCDTASVGKYILNLVRERVGSLSIIVE